MAVKSQTFYTENFSTKIPKNKNFWSENISSMRTLHYFASIIAVVNVI